MDMTPEQFVAMLNRVANEAVDQAKQGTNEVAEDLLNVSQKLAPLDQGFLISSGSVDSATQQGDSIVARTGFNTEYALRMHEDFYNLGNTSRQKPGYEGMTVGRKYLEKPTYKYAEKYSKHIADKVNGVFE